jgi:hypothetical protein
MQLTIERAYELVTSHGVFARDYCDRCGRLLVAVRFTRRDEVGEWCSRECRGDAERQAVRKGGRPRKYRSLEDRRAAKTRQQRDCRNVAVWKKPTRHYNLPGRFLAVCPEGVSVCQSDRSDARAVCPRKCNKLDGPGDAAREKAMPRTIQPALQPGISIPRLALHRSWQWSAVG